jgi:hypothetical protein
VAALFHNCVQTCLARNVGSAPCDETVGKLLSGQVVNGWHELQTRWLPEQGVVEFLLKDPKITEVNHNGSVPLSRSSTRRTTGGADLHAPFELGHRYGGPVPKRVPGPWGRSERQCGGHWTIATTRVDS